MATTDVISPQVPSEQGKFGNLRYPSDHDATSGNWIVITEYEYHRVTANESATPKRTGNSVTLPIPTNLETFYAADWDTLELGALGSMTSDRITNLGMKAATEGIGAVAQSIRDSVMEAYNAGSVGDTSKRYLTALMLDSADSVGVGGKILNTLGRARNPFVSAQFRSIQFRTFDFNYSFISKSFEESQLLQRIITSLKAGMHPEYDESMMNALFKYPNLFKIEFSHPQYLFNIGFCTLNQVSVNYHAQGNPIYHAKDGMKIPAHIQFSLRFTEIEINTRKQILEDGR